MSARRPFERFHAALAGYPAEFLALVDAHSETATPGEWRVLALEARDAVELANGYDPLDELPEKRHQPRRRSTAATSTSAGSLVLATDDPLKQIEPRVYVEAMAGEVVPASGWISCPLPDHDDHTPSFQVLDSHWRCFGCGRGGGIIDLGAALYGVEPRGESYWRLRDRILEVLVWSPLRHEVRHD
jgi:hypothetical protein